jgi:CheY-like chemotaxis protein
MTTSSNKTSLLKPSKTILLVDDQSMTLLVMKDSLESEGHRVLAAQSVREALNLYTQHQDKIHLVITDMRMPNMDGSALIAVIHAHDASLPILIVSGYYDPDLLEIVNQPDTYLLHKPFGITELREVLQEIFPDG